MSRAPLLLVLLVATTFGPIFIPRAFADEARVIALKEAPAPADNPLKGLVPYVGQGDPFPHSMEFWYFAMNQLMPAENQYDWSAIESKLNEIGSRRCQAVIRVFMEYPGRPPAVPQFLVDQGVKVTRYEHDGSVNHTPDYNDPRTRKAMRSFIAAYGEKYDGDPRIGFITMGMLGHWGEWHTYPKDDLFASEEVQAEVMDAFEAAFPTTRILMRYPAGTDAWKKAPNHKRGFGYHDDSFAWATLDTGREGDEWFFQSLLRSAGAAAIEKWKTAPIGGEIRPEVWGCVFDQPSCAPKGQEIEACILQTHATWLMDSGMFSLAKTKPTAERRNNAIRLVRKMGYELHLPKAELLLSGSRLAVSIDVTNRGVAPFYYDWPVTISVQDQQGATVLESQTDWKLTGIQPDRTVTWKANLDLPRKVDRPQVRIRASNPMPGGKPLRFANESQADDGWLILR